MLKYFVTGAVLLSALLSAAAPASAHKDMKNDTDTKSHSHGQMESNYGKPDYKSKKKYSDKNDDYYPDQYGTDKDAELDTQYSKDSFYKGYGEYNQDRSGYKKPSVIIVPVIPVPKLPIYTTPPFNPNPDASYDDSYYGGDKYKGSMNRSKHHRYNKHRNMDRMDRYRSNDNRYDERYDDSKKQYRDGYNQKDNSSYKGPIYQEDYKRNQNPLPVIELKPAVKLTPPVYNPDIKKSETKKPDVKKAEVPTVKKVVKTSVKTVKPKVKLIPVKKPCK